MQTKSIVSATVDGQFFRVLGIHNFATKYNPSKADCVIHLNFMFVKKLAMNGKIS